MRYIIAPDKFKGSLSSFQVCESIRAGIVAFDPEAEILSFPLADGGDGFAEVMQYYLHTESIWVNTVDPLGRPHRAAYQWNGETKTAIIELASASGLQLLQPGEQNPLHTSTYGSGLMIKDAVQRGAVQIVLGLGGSATNDGGLGILAALGFNIFAHDELLKPLGQNLVKVNRIVPPDIPANCVFTIACDVQNVLFGPQGAAYVYAPQKGATAADVALLDEGLRNLNSVLLQQTGVNVQNIPGTGAAGGIAAVLIAFFNAQLRNGSNIVFEASGLHGNIRPGDIVFTGEGRIDEQSLQGKVVGRVAKLAHEQQATAIALCGTLSLSPRQIKDLQLHFACSICNQPMSLNHAIARANELLQQTTANICRLILSLR